MRNEQEEVRLFHKAVGTDTRWRVLRPSHTIIWIRARGAQIVRVCALGGGLYNVGMRFQPSAGFYIL